MNIANVVVGARLHGIHENSGVGGERNFELLYVLCV